MIRVKLAISLWAIVLIQSCSSSSSDVYSREFTDWNNASIQLSGLKENPYTVFVAFANDCPVCKASIPTLRKLNEVYPNVGLVLFYPANQRDSNINAFISSLLPKKTICVKDKNKFLTQTLQATVTPHAFILNQNGSVVYRGAINNGVFTNYRKNYAKQESFLLNALDTLIHLEQKLIKHETKVVGCYIE